MKQAWTKFALFFLQTLFVPGLSALVASLLHLRIAELAIGIRSIRRVWEAPDQRLKGLKRFSLSIELREINAQEKIDPVTSLKRDPQSQKLLANLHT